MPSTNHSNRDIVSDLTRGALAGVAATWIMGKATSYLYQHESKKASEAESEARQGKTAYGVAAEKAAEVVGQALSEEERKKAGQKIHWALGIGAGAVYGALRGRAPGAGWGHGLAFGAGFFLLVDELANTALGLTPPPTAFPWQTHARGLAGHLAFGLVADLVLDLMEHRA